ncbi:MAG TPA: hypothetical protein VFB31_19120 [Pseudolabrys sp.]|nr:hypothetical protein [Pseudolabrys sp.]
MRLGATGFGLILAVSITATVPASAEFFNCNQRPGQVLYSYGGSPSQYGSRTTYSRHTTDYSAQSYRRRYQSHASYFGSRYDRSRW